MFGVEDIISKQKAFYKTGKTKEVIYRKQNLQKLKEVLKANEVALSKAMEKDLGKHSLETYMSELGVLYESINLIQRNISVWQKKQRVKTPLFLLPAKSYTQAEPLGQVFIISAFNYPLLLSLDPLVGAIAGGNVAMVALSETTPAINKVLMELMAATFPEEYIFFFEGNKERNIEVLTYRFDKIFFTGSSTVGKSVMAAASHHLTPITLELGGKSPALITDKAKLSHAAECVVWGKFLNAGQTCVAPDYCLVDKKYHDEFINLVKQKLVDFYGVDPAQSDEYGRVANERATLRLEKLMKQDQEYVVFGGQIDKMINYVAPTLLKGTMTTALMSMEEEVFGPILPILSYESLEEALQFIESKEKPLAFYPFTQSSKEASYLTTRLSFGGSTVNDTILHLANSHLPFGGVGQSGMGQYHGKASFACFTHQKSILKRSSLLRLSLMNPPYSKLKEKMITLFLK